MSEVKKYRIAYGVEEANRLYEEGYKVHTYNPNQGVNDTAYWHIFIMSLGSEKAYDNITNLKDIAPDQVDGYLAMGWVVADSWSKIVRVVKKRDPDEWIHVDNIDDWVQESDEYFTQEQAYEHVMDNPPDRGI